MHNKFTTVGNPLNRNTQLFYFAIFIFFLGGGWRGGLSFNRTLESCAISIFRTV